MKLQAPIDVELQVKIISDDKEQHGTVTIGMSKGTFPTENELRERVAEFVKTEMPEGFQLMTKREYWDAMMAEHTGSSQRFALPGGDDWDD